MKRLIAYYVTNERNYKGMAVPQMSEQVVDI